MAYSGPMTDPVDIERLRRIGWRGDAEAGPGRLARVVAQHRAGYELHDGDLLFNAQPAGAFLKRGLDPSLRPAVGDFVLLSGDTHPVIETVLPRRTLLVRAAAGERYERQVIAANIDYVLVLMGLDDDYVLPPNYNEAYHLTGDGVVVDVVRHLARHLLEPLLGLGEPAREAA